MILGESIFQVVHNSKLCVKCVQLSTSRAVETSSERMLANYRNAHQTEAVFK